MKDLSSQAVENVWLETFSAIRYLIETHNKPVAPDLTIPLENEWLRQAKKELQSLRNWIYDYASRRNQIQ